MEPGQGAPEQRFDSSASLVVNATPILTLPESYLLKREMLPDNITIYSQSVLSVDARQMDRSHIAFRRWGDQQL
ncbi:MAG: hypothetical protein NTY51_14790 [Deltaproteobacteria bacterium]|nr:hypothetical protein [Deltaproteobacteria bacterium]